MRHTKFHQNRSTGSAEEEFWRVFTIYGHGDHLGHVTSIMLMNFHFHVPKSLHTIFCHIFIKSITCSLMSQAAIVLEKSTFFTFSYRKAKVKKFDLAIK